MSVLTIALLAQLAAAREAAPQSVLPVLAFPEPGVDDSAAYQGYHTRFFRDAAGNTVQVYLAGRDARVVHLLADAENASVGFTARDPRGQPAPLRWDGAGAVVSRSGDTRRIEYRLAADLPRLYLGWFLLGSMRVERDFQYAGGHRIPFAYRGQRTPPFGGTPFTLPEIDRLVAALDRLDPAERRRHLAPLNAADTRTLRARLRPTLTTRRGDTSWVARVVQPSLDGRDTLVLELAVNPRRAELVRGDDWISLRSRTGSQISFTVGITTTGDALTPLTREEIFTPDFLAFLAAARAEGDAGGAPDSAALRARLLERQVRGVELLVSREKLMAGLPAYATYFGRDMLVSALMMQSIWRGEVAAFAIASALRRLSPSGQVSHEEALGGQAVREGAAEYAALVDEYLRARRAGRGAAADSLLARARAVVGDLRRTRENYHMIDDELQLPVLTARWLGDADVPAARKRAFLLDSTDGGGTRLARLLRELALVARMTAAYAADPVVGNLVSFAPRDSGEWAATSWRDSRVGYAGGRYAMDVNAIWAPHALESIQRIFVTLPTLGFRLDSLARAVPEMAAGTALGGFARDPQVLARAMEAWGGASRHFLVRLAPAEVRARVGARLDAMPAAERAHWAAVLAARGADRDSLEFLALSLDAEGRPIGVVNTDVATGLFLGEIGAARGAFDPARAERVLRDVRLFVRDYPVALFIDRVGPVVANDAYAPPAVWAAFERDRYHGPRVVWGREVNLFLLGVADRIATAPGIAGGPSRPWGPAQEAYVRELRSALAKVLAAAEASGFQSELWSYEVADGRVVPVRYGTGSDVQLWSTTDLAVQYALARLGR